MKSWTLDFARSQLPRMSALSVLRYRRYLVRAKAGHPRGSDVIRLKMKYPITGTLWLRELGSDSVTYQEVMESQVYRPVREALARCEWIVDLGANIGLASRYFLERFPAARLLAVEPNSSSYALLVRNLAVESAMRATAVRAAIWGESAPVMVTNPGIESRYDCVRVSKLAPAERTDADIVRGYRLSELCAEYCFPRIDLLKVDIEGTEIELFAGDISWLDRVGTIAIEFHGASRTLSNFDSKVQQYGFVVDDSNPHTVIARRTRNALFETTVRR